MYLTGIHKENTLRTILFILTKNFKKFLRNLIRTVTINRKNSALKAFPVEYVTETFFFFLLFTKRWTPHLETLVNVTILASYSVAN